MYAWLADFLDETYGIGLSREGAPEEEIARVETALRVPLPPSYREFLKVCNGGEIYGYYIFSTTELLRVPAEFGFRPYQGCIETGGESFGTTYGKKPANLLPVASIINSPDLYCIDICPNGKEEKPICKFDPEVEDLDLLLQPHFPDFEAFFLDIVNVVSEELESYLQEDDDLWDEEKVELAEKRLRKWQNVIRGQLVQGGADMTDPWEPDWANWHGSTGQIKSYS